MKEVPRIGDIVRIKSTISSGFANADGIVLRLRMRKDGYWIAAELLIAGQQRWFNKGDIANVVGRPRGISRIDQAARRTHGWYVRLYEGSKVRSRLFSDKKYNGIGPALQAALDYYEGSLQKGVEQVQPQSPPIELKKEIP